MPEMKQRAERRGQDRRMTGMRRDRRGQRETEKGKGQIEMPRVIELEKGGVWGELENGKGVVGKERARERERMSGGAERREGEDRQREVQASHWF
jgi:hypothetical protein